MRHCKKKKMPARNSSHRRALQRNLASSLFINGQITTTISKAKALRPYAEKLITLSKNAELSFTKGRRLSYWRKIREEINRDEPFYYLTRVWARHCRYRNGGYLRIIKLGKRPSDSSELAIIQMVPEAISRDGSIVNTMSDCGFEEFFSSLAKGYLDDVNHKAKTISKFSNEDLPDVVLKSRNVYKNGRMTLKLGFEKNPFFDIQKWPKHRGEEVLLPITISSMYSRGSLKTLEISSSNELKSTPSFNSSSELRVLYNPIKPNQEIYVEAMPLNNWDSVTYFVLSASSPVGDLFAADLCDGGATHA